MKKTHEKWPKNGNFWGFFVVAIFFILKYSLCQDFMVLRVKMTEIIFLNTTCLDMTSLGILYETIFASSTNDKGTLK